MISEIYAKAYCKDFNKIENYAEAISSNKFYECHHKMENLGFTKSQLIQMDMYYDVSPEYLIFLQRSDHKRLHMLGNNISPKSHSEEWKRRVSEKLKGNKSRTGMKNSEESKRKVSEKLKGRTCPNKGKHWRIENGKRIYY